MKTRRLTKIRDEFKSLPYSPAVYPRRTRRLLYRRNLARVVRSQWLGDLELLQGGVEALVRVMPCLVPISVMADRRFC